MFAAPPGVPSRTRALSLLEAGQAALLVGRVEVTSLITHAREDLTYAVLHLGNHNIVAGVRLATVNTVGSKRTSAEFQTVINSQVQGAGYSAGNVIVERQ